ncbi:Polycystic kidney disease protein 1-like 3 [Wickerhamomyces ciferrii]|uniref:Polycystic kidney disease protein 1-like 3 n=1 Tax=Wickerhamomyces ciferrii (strain ATCC 14091 / BCRC 22168 / CBS 111 / JCM 3599 / NBRC 0793 / NRRL Y-1031 F-60-10) TaxID=1206466 RepID=K0KGW7_WICCF|nr:Polycystic kidney disease protein 1-like 3 [Wickerhamomyces ciferrii]CCH42221.1 Polycystic kidney disease protein 1-like 3 [Wickerhamomyces ciferrii]
MALANRRPVGFPMTDSTVTTSTTSPAFKPRRLSLNATDPKSKINTKIESVSSSSSNLSDDTDEQLVDDLKIEDDEENQILEEDHDVDMKEMTPEKSSSPEDFKDVSPTSTIATSISSSSNSQSEKSNDSKDSSTSTTTTKKEPKPKKSKAEKGDKPEKEKKHNKPSTRAPIATGISTTIPVTGERPRPTQHSSLDDGVLFAIFEILFDKDDEGKGMTVKQICDILVERHPEMANLSTKTSNLVSAKLNAYVKRVEKGEKSLIYSLSREWADASPKRMVYVYRGLLAPDYYVHALAAIDAQKSQEPTKSSTPMDGESEAKFGERFTPFESLNDGFNGNSNGNGNHEIKRRATAFDLGVTKHTFADLQLDYSLPQLSIPYSAAPVTASLGLGSTLKSPTSISKQYKSPIISDDLDLDDISENFQQNLNDDEDDDDDFLLDDDLHLKITYHRNNKRSKSMSYLTSKKSRTLTVAAAAPRFSKVAVSPSPSAAAAAAALHAAALEGLSPAGSVATGITTSSNPSNSPNSLSSKRQSMSCEPPIAAKWLKAVKEGFLTQDIETPEDISLAELDSLLT